jgi:hypothetical protein
MVTVMEEWPFGSQFQTLLDFRVTRRLESRLRVWCMGPQHLPSTSKDRVVEMVGGFVLPRLMSDPFLFGRNSRGAAKTVPRMFTKTYMNTYL